MDILTKFVRISSVGSLWLQQKLPEFGFRTHTTAISPVEQSSILSAKFDCPVARQNVSLLATAHDCETGLWSSLPFCLPS